MIPCSARRGGGGEAGGEAGGGGGAGGEAEGGVEGGVGGIEPSERCTSPNVSHHTFDLSRPD